MALLTNPQAAAAAVRAALGELRWSAADRRPRGVDYGRMSLLRDRRAEVCAFQLTSSTSRARRAPGSRNARRTTFALVAFARVCSAPAAARATALTSPRASSRRRSRSPASASAPSTAAAAHILGTAPPPEDEVVLVTDRRPDGRVVDPTDRAVGRRSPRPRHEAGRRLAAARGQGRLVHPRPAACTHVQGRRRCPGQARRHRPRGWLEKAELVGELSWTARPGGWPDRRPARARRRDHRDRQAAQGPGRRVPRGVRKHRDGEADGAPR